MSPASKDDLILEEVPIAKILYAISSFKRRGRPESLNTRAMIFSLILCKIEHIRFIKDLVNRLKSSAEFRLRCHFTGSDRVPSQAAYSRLFTKLQQSGILHEVIDITVDAAITEGFLKGESMAVDSSHVEAFDRNPKIDASKPAPSILPKEVEDSEEPAFLDAVSHVPQPAPKPEKPKRVKRGRVPKAEEAAWRAQVEAYEASLTHFEKEVAGMLSCSYEELIADMPTYPSVGAKGDPRGNGRVKYWYGYKLNLLVDCQSQYIVTGVNCSAHVNDQRPAIVLLKRLKERFPTLQPKYVLGDKGYDSEPVYQQVRDVGACSLIPLVHRTKLPDGVDKHLRPTCKQGHSYRYDSYDATRDTVKFVAPKECAACPFQADGCQKVIKKQVKEDVRRYTAPGRGSEKFHQLFKQRTAVERVFAYLKLYLELGTTRKLKRRAFVDMDLSCLTYNVCKLAIDKLNKRIREAKPAA
ncbi:transposase [Cohnella rhizosphaerae]|uniref:transposase n=1 Tax=Cohnella rhizosphaerae TaxID=1457232 RepID=UPI003B8A69D1